MSITERNSDLTTLDTDRIMSSEDGAKLIENMNKSTVKDHTLFLFQNGYPKTKIIFSYKNRPVHIKISGE